MTKNLTAIDKSIIALALLLAVVAATVATTALPKEQADGHVQHIKQLDRAEEAIQEMKLTIVALDKALATVREVTE